MLITFYAVGFVIAVTVTAGSYFYAKRALREIRARVVARATALEAFDFDELEAAEDETQPVLPGFESFKSLDSTGRRTTVELISVGTFPTDEGAPRTDGARLCNR